MAASRTSSARPRLDSLKSQASSVVPPTWSGRPASPSFSTTTTGSRVDLGAVHTLITRKDLRQSILCFEDLMAAAKAYRNAMLALSSATAAFASAMEACSRVKGCHSANSALAGASGLQFLVSNHEQILADGIYRQFEIPLLEALDNYKINVADRLATYEKGMHEQSTKIRKTEAENLKHGRRRKRDLQSFRAALAELQRQVDELDALKLHYHEEVLEGEDEIWDTVLGKVAFIVRSQLDFYEKIAGKASDPVLEPLVMSIPDPFDSYGPPKEDGQIFSVLAPLGLRDSSAPQTPSPNLTRTANSPSGSGSGDATPQKSIPFPALTVSPSTTMTAHISALGTVSGEDASEGSGSGKAQRELSVIEERDGSSIVIKEEYEVTEDEVEGDMIKPSKQGEEEEVSNVGEDDRPTVDRHGSSSPENPSTPVVEARTSLESLHSTPGTIHRVELTA